MLPKFELVPMSRYFIKLPNARRQGVVGHPIQVVAKNHFREIQARLTTDVMGNQFVVASQNFDTNAVAILVGNLGPRQRLRSKNVPFSLLGTFQKNKSFSGLNLAKLYLVRIGIQNTIPKPFRFATKDVTLPSEGGGDGEA